MFENDQIKPLRCCQYRSKTVLQFGEESTAQLVELENYFPDQANTTIKNKEGVESNLINQSARTNTNLPPERQQKRNEFSVKSASSSSLKAKPKSFELEAHRTTISKGRAAIHPAFPFLCSSPTPSSVAFPAAVVENPIHASSSPYQESRQKRSLLTKFVKHSSFPSSSFTFRFQNSNPAETMNTIAELSFDQLPTSTSQPTATRFKQILQKIRGNSEDIIIEADRQQLKKKRSLRGGLSRSASFIGIITDRSNNTTPNSIAPEASTTTTTASKNASFRGSGQSLASKIRNSFRPQYQPTKVHNTNYYCSSRRHQSQTECCSVSTGDDDRLEEVQKVIDKQGRSSKSGFSIHRSASLSTITQHFRSARFTTSANKKPKAEVYIHSPSTTLPTRSVTTLSCLSHSSSSSSLSSCSASLAPSVASESDDEEANEDRANALNDIILGQQKGSTRKLHSVLGLKKSISSHKLYMNKSQQQGNDDRVILDEGYLSGSNSSNNSNFSKYNTMPAPCHFVNNDNCIDTTMPSATITTITTNAGGAVIKIGPSSSLPPYSETAATRISAISHQENRRRGSTASSVGSTTRKTRRPVLRQASCSTTATSTSSFSSLRQNSGQLLRVRFMKLVMVRETFSKVDYDRASDPNAVCTRLTPFIAEQIKEELNTFKLHEMQVHEFSRGNTQFFL